MNGIIKQNNQNVVTDALSIIYFILFLFNVDFS